MPLPDVGIGKRPYEISNAQYHLILRSAFRSVHLLIILVVNLMI